MQERTREGSTWSRDNKSRVQVGKTNEAQGERQGWALHPDCRYMNLFSLLCMQRCSISCVAVMQPMQHQLLHNLLTFAPQCTAFPQFQMGCFYPIQYGHQFVCQTMWYNHMVATPLNCDSLVLQDFKLRQVLSYRPYIHIAHSRHLMMRRQIKGTATVSILHTPWHTISSFHTPQGVWLPGQLMLQLLLIDPQLCGKHWVSLIAGLECGIERWNGNGMECEYT